MKKYLLTLTLLTTITQAITQKKPIKLESPALALSDGKSYGFNVSKLLNSRQLHKALTDILYGKKNSRGERVGLFLYEGNSLSIQALCAIEQKNQTHNTDLDNILTQSKKYFNVTVAPFKDDLGGVRPIMLEIIKESCEKRQRLDSYLLTWGKCPEGKEEEIFNKGITSFKKFEQFVFDLINFLEDIIYSCPKACAQLKEQIANQKHE